VTYSGETGNLLNLILLVVELSGTAELEESKVNGIGVGADADGMVSSEVVIEVVISEAEFSLIDVEGKVGVV
jgi:hypothetical protein